MTRPIPDPGTIRAVRITPDGVLDVVHIPARYDALADTVGAPHAPGNLGITAAGTWRMSGVGYLTLWTAGTGPRNELAERVADRIVSRAGGGFDRIRDRIAKGALAGTIVLVAYDRATGDPADVGDVAVERVREVADGRLRDREAAAAREATTTSLPTVQGPVTAALDIPAAAAPVERPLGGVADLVRRIHTGSAR